MEEYPYFTDYVYIFNVDFSVPGTASWTSAVDYEDDYIPIDDKDGDGNLDSTDTILGTNFTFSGYYWVHPESGKTYAIFQEFSDFVIPYNRSFEEIGPFFTGEGSTSQFMAEDFVPTGNPICFLQDSLIATPRGETPVQDLRIGDRILSQSGHILTVKWIGRQTVSTRFGPAERLMPVRFAGNSLGDGSPNSDLTVTADHAVLVDGVLCNAGALVNGITITRVPLSELGDRYTVYHIETERHEIILANGAPAETFIDNVSRRVFDNYAEFEALYGDVPEMEELPYPRAMSARQVPAQIKDRLAVRKCA